MKKTIHLLLVLMLTAVISNAQDDKKMIKSGDIEAYATAEVMPQFTGGNDALVKFLSDNIKYPESAKINKQRGTVFVQFIVNAEGKVVNPKVPKSSNADLDAEALRVISLMPAWTPGKQDGKNVNVAFTLPVKFTL